MFAGSLREVCYQCLYIFRISYANIILLAYKFCLWQKFARARLIGRRNGQKLLLAAPHAMAAQSMRNINFIERLPDGHAGTLRTLDVMRALARRDYLSVYVVSTVRSILQKAPTLPTVPALYLFARDAIRYVSDPPHIEYVQDFKRCTESRMGDCDDKCVWLATALLSVDCPVRYVVQSFDGTFLENGWDHVFIEYYDWEKWRWVALDPTADAHTGIMAPVGWRQVVPPGGAEMHYEI